MSEIKERLGRIEKQGIDAHISSKVLEHSYEAHKAQNEKDFQHVDDCIHRSESESKSRDDSIADELKEIRADILQLKQFQWKALGALLVLVPLANHIAGKFL